MWRKLGFSKFVFIACKITCCFISWFYLCNTGLVPRNHEGRVLILNFKDNTPLQRISFKYREEGGGGEAEKTDKFSIISQLSPEFRKLKDLCFFTLFKTEVIFKSKEAISPEHFPQHGCELLSEFHICRLMWSIAELPLTVVYRYLEPIDDILESSGVVHYISGTASMGHKNCLALDCFKWQSSVWIWGSKLVAIHNSWISESIDRLHTPLFFFSPKSLS